MTKKKILVSYTITKEVEIPSCGSCGSDLLETNFESEASKKFVRCTSCGFTLPPNSNIEGVIQMWTACSEAMHALRTPVPVANPKPRKTPTRLTDSQREALLSDYTKSPGGLTKAQLARKYNLSSGGVNSVIKNALD